MYKSRIDYIQKVFAPESEKLKAIRETTTDPNDQIRIHAQEGKLLQLLVKLVNARKIVEIGTLAGYSTQWLLEALPPDGHSFTLEHDPVRAARAQKNLSSPQVTLVPGDVIATGTPSGVGMGFRGSGLRACIHRGPPRHEHETGAKIDYFFHRFRQCELLYRN